MAAKAATLIEKATGLEGDIWETKQLSEEPRLVMRVISATEQHYEIVNRIAEDLPDENPYRGRVSVAKRPLKELTLESAEVLLLTRTLSSTLTADRHADATEFRTRYISSQSGAEQQVTAMSNNIVFGRRGAGKSTLLVYAQHHFQHEGLPCAWLDMQTYEGRNDTVVHIDVLDELAETLNELSSGAMNEFLLASRKLRDEGEPTLPRIRRLMPSFKRGALHLTRRHGGLGIFLDDLHVVPKERQPELLTLLYSFSRGNRIWLKVSALEHFTNHWDPVRRVGLEAPGDAQTIHLDYNLTDPRAALRHTTRIMDAIAMQCALPGIGAILNSGVLARLVWVAAGVPRDALDILRQSISTAAQKRRTSKKLSAPSPRKKVAVEDVNTAASRCIENKLQFLSLDSSLEQEPLATLLESVKQFCIKEEKRNAFLVRIRHESSFYQQFLKLIDLRFLHVLNPGITKSRTGEKFVALLLDYGFYTGTRRAKTVDVLQKEPERLPYDLLRRLPVFEPDERPGSN
ncbi:MAG: hypothetical protein MJD61_18300 [Proteobacteria bacterium]|nr:hypothetical protein [Pseudomonadota bacterium]